MKIERVLVTNRKLWCQDDGGPVRSKESEEGFLEQIKEEAAMEAQVTVHR